jgi:large subunit ribosomal protein L13
MRTFNLKPADVEKQWVVIDAAGVVLGRLAAQIAMLLRGKDLPTYTPHVDCGKNVIIINADQIRLTGKKLEDKVYYRHTGHPGGIKETTPQKLLSGRFPERVIELAVKRMLPKESPLARQQFKNLRVYAGSQHPHQAQNPQLYDFASKNAKNKRS